MKAEQTNVWHNTGELTPQKVAQEPIYDAKKLRDYVQESVEHNSEWTRWFELNAVIPLEVEYEELQEDHSKTIRGILAYLSVDVPENLELSAPNKRLANTLNEEWIQRYNSEVHNF